MSLETKTVLITGGSEGIGLATALRFAKAGASVAIASRSHEHLQTAMATLAGVSSNVFSIIADVSKPGDIKKMASHAIQQLGSVDILINNAAIYPITPFLSIELAELNDVINTNLRGTFLASQAIVPHMIAQGGGTIISLTSVESHTPKTMGLTHYHASKLGIIGLTAAMAVELSQHNIRVHALAVGPTATPGVNRASRSIGATPPHVRARTKPLQSPEEAAEEIFALAYKSYEQSLAN